MSADVIPFPNRNEPSVYLLNGRSGIGKTRLLSFYAERYPVEFKYFLPMSIGEKFKLSAVDFRVHPVIAIDEVLQWDAKTMPGVIRNLEHMAFVRGGKIILVVQHLKDFLTGGFSLRRPAVPVPILRSQYDPRDLERLPKIKTAVRAPAA